MTIILPSPYLSSLCLPPSIGQPAVLLQQTIDVLSRKDYDAVVLIYGLCGQATLGLVAREIPIVIPRTHDCITLFLDSRTRY